MEENKKDNQKLSEDFFAKIDSEGERGGLTSESQSVSEPQTSSGVVPPFVGTELSSGEVYPQSSVVPSGENLAEGFSGPPNKRNLKKILTILVSAFLVFGLIFFLIGNLLSRFKKGGEVTLTYWGLWEPEVVMNEVIAEYQKSHPKIKINYLQQSPKDYRERLQSAIARGEGPDIFRFHNTWVPMLKDNLSPLPSSFMDAATFEKTFYPVAKNDLQVGGNFFGVPLEIDNLALFINEEIFDSAGKTPPKTWDEFRKVALELTVKDSSGKIQTSGAALGITSNVDHWSDILGLMLLQNGADPGNPTTNLAEDALTFYSLFYSSDRVWNEMLPSSTYYFASGRLAMYFGPSWRVFDIKALNPSLKFKIIPVPQLPGVNITWATYWAEGVSKKSSHQNEAWEFLKFLSSPQTLQKLYQAQSKIRLFGEPYARIDMADYLKNEPLVGVFIQQAPMAKSWYLCSRTFDNGINDKIIKYYEDAVNMVSKRGNAKAALATVAQGVAQVLGQYGAK